MLLEKPWSLKAHVSKNTDRPALRQHKRVAEHVFSGPHGPRLAVDYMSILQGCRHTGGRRQGALFGPESAATTRVPYRNIRSPDYCVV